MRLVPNTLAVTPERPSFGSRRTVLSGGLWSKVVCRLSNRLTVVGFNAHKGVTVQVTPFSSPLDSLRALPLWLRLLDVAYPCGQPLAAARHPQRTDRRPAPNRWSLAIHDSPPAIDDSPLAIDDSPPAIHDSPPAIDDSPPAIDDSPPAIDDSPPAIDDSPPAIDDSPPAIDDSPPTIDDLPPAIDDSPPAIDDSPLTTYDSSLATYDSPKTPAVSC